MTHIILALVIGALFGFVLDRIGATNPQYILKMLNLTDMHLAKTILLAIGVGSVLIFGGQMLGIVDVGHMSVKATHLGVVVGGFIFGIGWALSGFCPGTGVCAAVTGRKDALFFIAGGLLGAAAYMAVYADVKASGLLDKVAGGKVTLGTIPGSKYHGITELPGDVVGIVLGLMFIALAFALPERLRGAEEGAGATQPAE